MVPWVSFLKNEVLVIWHQMILVLKKCEHITEINEFPFALFVVNVKTKLIDVLEAKKLGILAVPIVNTNSDPNVLIYIIPGNDDFSKSIKIIID
jgi:small subunit ribosomal protein S2